MRSLFRRRVLLLLAGYAAVVGCLSKPALWAESEPIRIMRMGDSITRYMASTTGLKNGLDALGIDYELVGSQHWTDARKPHRFCEGYNGEKIEFFTNLQSEYGGKSTNQYQFGAVHENSIPVKRACEVYQPHMILLKVGTNNLSSSYEPNYEKLRLTYEELLDAIRQYSPEAHIFVATILPVNNAHKYNKISDRNARHAEFNEKVVRPMVADRKSNGEPFTLVELFDVIDPAQDLTDPVHPAVSGQHKLNARWLEAIQAHLQMP